MRWPIAVVAAIVVILYVLHGAALPHDAPRGWSYDLECCSDRDCAPYPAKGIKELPGGHYQLPTGEVVDRSRIKRSQDEEYHLCRMPGGDFIFCLYVPPSGS